MTMPIRIATTSMYEILPPRVSRWGQESPLRHKDFVKIEL
jgi:hypothetical protein